MSELYGKEARQIILDEAIGYEGPKISRDVEVPISVDVSIMRDVTKLMSDFVSDLEEAESGIHEIKINYIKPVAKLKNGTAEIVDILLGFSYVNKGKEIHDVISAAKDRGEDI